MRGDGESTRVGVDDRRRRRPDDVREPVHDDESGSSSQKTKLPRGAHGSPPPTARVGIARSYARRRPFGIPRNASTSSRLFTTTSPVHFHGKSAERSCELSEPFKPPASWTPPNGAMPMFATSPWSATSIARTVSSSLRCSENQSAVGSPVLVVCLRHEASTTAMLSDVTTAEHTLWGDALTATACQLTKGSSLPTCTAPVRAGRRLRRETTSSGSGPRS